MCQSLMRDIVSPLDGFASPFPRRDAAPFTISFTGLSTDSLGTYAQVGDHAGIGYTIDPDNGTEAVKWSNSSDPDATATYGTGASPTDFTAGDEGNLWLHVTDGSETVSRSAAIRRAPGTGPTIADQDAWSVGVAITPIDISASGTGLTFDYTVENLPAGLTVDTENEQISGTPTETFDDTITVIPEDQYGRTEEYVETFAASAVLPAVGTFGALTNQSFTENSGDQTYQHAAATGAGLTFTYAQVGSVAGVTYNPSTRTFTFDTDALAVQSGTTLQVSATDQYGRAATSSPRSFTFDITAAAPTAVNPTLTLGSQSAGSGGNPDSIAVSSYSYAGADTVTLYAVTANSGTVSDTILAADGTAGANAVETDNQPNYTGQQIDLDGFTDDTVTHLHVVAVEDNNGGTSGVQVVALTDIDFTAPVVSSVATNTAGDQITITFDEAVIGTNDAADFAMSGHTLSSMAGTGTTRTLAVSPAVASGDTDTLSYTPGNLTNVRGNALAAFSGQAIVNNVPPASSGPTVSGTTGSPTVTTGQTFDGKTGTVYEFTASGSITFSTTGDVYYLVVAGGGGGGNRNSGGGGAGGMLGGDIADTLSVSTGTYTLTVGAGAPSQIDLNRRGGSGSDSSIAGPGIVTLTANGGGGGGADTDGERVGSSGGSGGGGRGYFLAAGGAGTPGQGNDGGAGSGIVSPFGAGGGGGAGAAGGQSINGDPGPGGNGLVSSITGASVTYAGGGGGGYPGSSSAAAGGSGGGGVGGTNVGAAGDGTNGLGGGGGGGGGSATVSYVDGGAGGSGVIVLFVPDGG